MKQIKINLKGHKLTKCLPKVWTTSDVDKPDNELFVLEDFSICSKKLFDSLVGIKKYYQSEFDADNAYTIDEIISLFDSAYEKIVKNLILDKKVRNNLINEKLKTNKDYYNSARFSILENIPKNLPCFDLVDNKIVGFSDECFSKISKYAKQIFMIEKICSFTTRKFWQKEITRVEDLDLNKNYKILVKCVFPNGWRTTPKSKKFDDYMEDRKFQSTSIIDERNFYRTIFSFASNYALLLMDYNDDDFVCASPTDSYSEEVINKINLLKDKKVFSDVLLQKEENIENKNHKFFAEAVECETPKNLLNNIKFYTEINLKQIKPKAVIAPNKESLSFATELAKKYGDLPVIIKPEIE